MEYAALKAYGFSPAKAGEIVLDNHRAAADAVCAKRGDGWRIVASASMPDGRGYAFTAEYNPE